MRRSALQQSPPQKFHCLLGHLFQMNADTGKLWLHQGCKYCVVVTQNAEPGAEILHLRVRGSGELPVLPNPETAHTGERYYTGRAGGCLAEICHPPCGRLLRQMVRSGKFCPDPGICSAVYQDEKSASFKACLTCKTPPNVCKLSNCAEMLKIVINKVWIGTALFYKIVEKE